MASIQPVPCQGFAMQVFTCLCRVACGCVLHGGDGLLDPLPLLDLAIAFFLLLEGGAPLVDLLHLFTVFSAYWLRPPVVHLADFQLGGRLCW
jgi:hypothetical protein